MALLAKARLGTEAEFAPARYNIGINDGAAAGQTAPHLHIHLIPRFAGDVPDPRRGVRWVIPAKPTTGNLPMPPADIAALGFVLSAPKHEVRESDALANGPGLSGNFQRIRALSLD